MAVRLGDYYDMIWGLLRPYKKRIAILLFTSILMSLISLIQPILRQRLVDDGIVKNDMSTVLFVLILITAVFIVNQIVSVVQFNCYTYVNEMMPHKLFYSALNHLLRLPVSYYKDTNNSQIIGDLSMDVSTISRVSDQMIVFSLVQALSMIGGVAGLMIINWKMTIAVLIVVPAKLIVNVRLSKTRQRAFKESMKLNSDFFEYLGEVIQGITILKLWNMFNVKLREFTNIKRKVIKNDYLVAGLDKKREIFSSSVDYSLSV